MKSAILVAALAGTAYAQPGNAPPTPPPAVPPPAVGSAPSDSVDVMASRWAVNLSLWFGGFTPRVDGSTSIPLAGLELSGRFRIAEPIELALSLQAGGGQDPNNNDMNSASVGGIFIDARWRFLYDRPWNVAAIVGIGSMSATAKSGATDEEKQARGALRVGVAVEHRWTHWAIEGVFRIEALRNNDAVTTVDLPSRRTYQLSRYGSTGANLVFGGSYYF